MDLQRVGALTAAVKTTGQVEKIAEQSPEFYTNLGNAAYAKGTMDAALAHYTEACSRFSSLLS